MIYFIQVDDRIKDVTLLAIRESVIEHSIKHGNYYFTSKAHELGKQIAPKNSSYIKNYAKIVYLRQFVAKAKLGDIIIYLDTDVYVATFDGLLNYIYKSNKSIFFLSYLTGMVNGSLIAVKVTPGVQELLGTMPTHVTKTTRINWLGEERVTSDEEVWNLQIENNINGFNMYIDFLDTRRFGSIMQKELFGNEIPHLQISNKTEIFHFMGASKKRYKEVIKQFTQQL